MPGFVAPARKQRLGLALSLLLAFWAIPAGSQPEWNPGRYRELVEQSNQAFENAQAFDEGAAERSDLLSESVELKGAAIDILRVGLQSGALDDYGQRPAQELLLLHQNVIVVLVEMGACTQARDRLEIALRDGSLLPDGGAGLIVSVQNRLDRCVDERSPSTDVGASGPERIREAQGEAPSEVATGGADAETVEHTTAAPPDSETVPPSDDGSDASSNASDPSDERVAAGGGHAEDASERLENVRPPGDGGGPGALPLVLIGSGVALAGAGVVLDIAGAGDRDDLEVLQAECAQRLCDYGPSSALEEDIQTNRIVSATLVGAGIATAAVGVVLWLTSDDGGETMAVAPVAGPYGVGVRGSF